MAVIVITLTLKKQKRSVRGDFDMSDGSNNNLNVQKIFRMTLGVVLLIIIAFGIWGIWRLDNTLQSINTNLASLDKNSSNLSALTNNVAGTDLTLSNIDKDLQNINNELFYIK
ncbi:MAG: hypothetical protein WAU62_13325 [Dehalococcoidales bacterium]